MIIKNVESIQTSGDYTAIFLDCETTITYPDEAKEIIPSVVYVPANACIYVESVSVVRIEF